MQIFNTSKLEIVVQSLNSNPNAVITDREDGTYLNGNYWRTPHIEPKSYVHVIGFRVAPKQGLYTVKELQAFMDGLVPDLEPFKKEDFKKESWLGLGKLYCGKLLFSEDIGHEIRGIEIHNTHGLEGFMAKDGFGDDGTKIFPETPELKLYRLIAIEIFPDVHIAQARENNDQTTFKYFGGWLAPISLRDLNSYKQSNSH